MLVVGIHLFVVAEFDQLFEVVAYGRVLHALLPCAFDGFGQREELRGVLGNIKRVGKDYTHIATTGLGNFCLPFGHKWFAGSDDQLIRIDIDGQNMKTRRIGDRHDVGDAGEIDLERVYANKRQLEPVCQPGSESVQCQQLVWWCGRFQIALRHGDQRNGILL